MASEHDRGAIAGREQEFFDAEARRLDPARMPPREYEPYESRFEDALLERCGDVAGKTVLDLGCGTGDLSLRLLKRGAKVTGLDLSPAAVEVARERAGFFLPDSEATFVVGAAEATGLPSSKFDFVLGKLVLHHVDLEVAGSEIARVLKADGMGAFVETSGLNPALRVARRALPGRFGIARYGTPDEHPLTRADLALFGRRFRRSEVDFPVMVLAYLLERHVLKWRFRGTDRALLAADRWLGRIERLRSLSYYVRITVHGAAPASPAALYSA